MLKGDLSSFSLGEIFQSLSINNHTGTLKINSPSQVERYIFFDHGEIRRLSTGTPEELRIGEILVQLGHMTVEDLDKARERTSQTRKSLALELHKRGLVTKDDIAQAIILKIQEELYDLFLWSAGNFEFDMGNCPDELFDEQQKSVPISINANSVIMEGLRRVDEWKVIHTKISTYDEVFIRTDQTIQGLDELQVAFLSQVDGTQPVSELLKNFYGTRFELCKLLYELLDHGFVRYLTTEECVDHASNHRRRKEMVEAVHFFRFATQLAPKDADLFRQLGEVLSATQQDDSAREAYCQALFLHYDSGDLCTTEKIGERLLPVVHHLSRVQLQVLFRTYLRLNEPKTALTVGNQLATVLHKEGEFDEAAEVLGSVLELNPNDLNLLVEIGTLFQKAGDVDRATTYFERVAETLESEKKYRELIKILRLLQTLHPKSTELKQRITATRPLVEKLAQQKKRRVTIAGIALISLLTVAMAPIIYEIKARELFSYAHRLEEVSLATLDFSRPKEAYVEILKRYSFSSKVAKAEEALDRIDRVEKEHLDKIGSVDETPEDGQLKELLKKQRANINRFLEKALDQEKAGDLKNAHKIYRHIFKTCQQLPELEQITLPLRITANPRSTDVEIIHNLGDEDPTKEKVISKTLPFIYRYRPGDPLRIRLSHKGNETIVRRIILKDQHELHFELRRTPTQEFQPAIGTHQNIESAHGSIVFPSRDGSLYGIDPDAGTIRWRRAVGRFGDRVSDILVYHDEVYISTITGEVTAISISNGKSRWVLRTSEPGYGAPATSKDNRWIALGTLAGNVHVIDNEKGVLAGKFHTENEIVAQPVFFEDWLIAGSRDNTLYFYSVAEKQVKNTLIFNDDISLDLVRDNSTLYVGTDDGHVHCVDLEKQNVVWSSQLKQKLTIPVLVSNEGVHVGTRSGRLITLEPKSGKLIHERVLGRYPVRSALVHNGLIYAGLGNGEVFALNAKTNSTLWSYGAGAPVLANPTIVNDKLVVANANGQFLVFEILE